MAAMSDLSVVTKALFGDLVDPDALVAKMDPGPSDVHSYGESNRAILIPRKVGRRSRVRKLEDGRRKPNQVGRRVMEGAGIGATGIGAALGVRELNHSIPLARGLWGSKRGWLMAAKPGSPLAKVPRPGSAARVAGVTGMLAGDAIATHEQVRNARRESVGKAVPMADMIRGILSNSRKATAVYSPQHAAGAAYSARHAAGVARHAGPRGVGNAAYRPTHAVGQARHAAQKAPKAVTSSTRTTSTPSTAAPAATPGAKGMDAGQRVRADVGRFAGTGTGKVVIGATGAGLIGHTLSSRRQAQAAAYDPYVGKRDEVDVTITGTFSKFDDDRRLAFGWANVSKLDGLPVVDRQGDYVAIEDIEDAAYSYVENSRVGGHMHRRVGGKAAGTIDAPYQAGTMVESMVFDDAKCDALGLPESFPRGWWFGMRVSDDDVWNLAKRGELTGFSVHGKGIRKSVEYDEIMGA